MSKRAIALGLIGAVLICTVTYFNDNVLRQTYLVGNNLPVSVFGTLVVFLFFNAYVYRLSHRIALTGREMALIMAMTLSACVVPTSGLMRTFATSLLLPHRMEKTRPGWAQARAVDEIAPEIMMVDVTTTLHKGELTGADGQTVTLGADAQNATGGYELAKIKMLSGVAEGQVRRIKKYDTETGIAELAEAFAATPAAGDRYRISTNNEAEVLTPFVQGHTDSSLESPVIPVNASFTAKTKDTVQLPEAFSDIDDTYTGMTFTVTSGELNETSRTISSYDGKTKVATLDDPLDEEVVNQRFRLEQPVADSRIAFWTPTRVRGLIQSAEGNQVAFPDTFSNISGAFCDMPITFLTGPLQGKDFMIHAYDGKERTATLDRAPETMPQPGDRFELVFEREVQLQDKALALPTDTENPGQKIQLAASAGHRDNEYNGLKIQIIAGKGEGHERKIIDYRGMSQIATVDRPWKTVPDASSTYAITEKPLVPWHAWSQTLWFWVPLIVAIFLAMIGLSFVFHQQWAEHEHLPYPIATFATSLMPEAESGRSSLVKDRRFLITAGVILTIYVFNYVCFWFPNVMQPIPTRFSIAELIWILPLKSPMWWQLWTVRIFFTVIAIAYFIPSDVSFSLGVSRFVFCGVMAALSFYGINMGKGPTNTMQYAYFLDAGAFLGTMLVILYIGRHYYLNVMKKAMFLRSLENLPATSIWGARVFIVGIIVFVAVLSRTGLSWQLGLLTGLALVILFSVIARVIAETGLFFIGCRFLPGAIIIGLLGTKALDPRSIFVIYLVTVIMAVDPREALMPFFVNSLKILDLRKLKLSKAGAACTAALLVGLAVGVPATIATQYKFGANLSDGHASKRVPEYSFKETLQLRQRMKAQGQLEEPESAAGLGRFMRIRPIKPGLLICLLIGVALVIVVSTLRLRFSKWPLHPVVFLIWGTWAPGELWSSFLIGWAFKGAVMRFGGSKVYQSLKPVVLGLVAGELLGAIVPIVVGFIYFLTTGELPKKFMIFPV